MIPVVNNRTGGYGPEQPGPGSTGEIYDQILRYPAEELAVAGETPVVVDVPIQPMPLSPNGVISRLRIGVDLIGRVFQATADSSMLVAIEPIIGGVPAGAPTTAILRLAQTSESFRELAGSFRRALSTMPAPTEEPVLTGLRLIFTASDAAVSLFLDANQCDVQILRVE